MESMEMDIIVYDFDDTIYDGDSTVDFYLFCLKQNPLLIRYSFIQIAGFIKYFFGIINKTQLKESFFSFLNGINDIEDSVEKFWNKNEKKIKQWYTVKNHDDDVIISASPEFLLSPISNRYNIKLLIASKVDSRTGEFYRTNCFGKEKVTRLNECIRNANIKEFYSDSISDKPLVEIAENSFFVDKNNISDWSEYNKVDSNNYKKIKQFAVFTAVGIVNTFNGVMFSYLFSKILSNKIAFIFGYCSSLIISYLLNSLITFREKLNFIKFVKFCLSYIPNFLIQLLLVSVLFDYAGMNKIVVYSIAALIGLPVTFVVLKIFTFNDVSKNNKRSC